MHKDERCFPEPDIFRPERYLDATGQVNHLMPDTHGQGHLSFGSGRRCSTLLSYGVLRAYPRNRVCVGKDLAMQILISNMCTLLWAFDIKPAVDNEGRPLLPSSVLVGDGVVK